MPDHDLTPAADYRRRWLEAEARNDALIQQLHEMQRLAAQARREFDEIIALVQQLVPVPIPILVPDDEVSDG